jgi:serine/threonine protein kinase
VEVEDTLSGTEEEPMPTLPRGRLGGDDELLPTTLLDRYQIERRLGAGAMGVVYAARDVHLRRAVAVKVVGPRIDTASGQGRLVREAQAMAKLRHPNLAAVHDIGVSNDRLFVVMELVDGGTVADWLKAAPRSWRAIVAVYLQAARGLAAAHAAGFVHRDFKPENVLYGTDGVARVSDFGVARILGDTDRAGPLESVAEHATVTRTGGVVGTPGYIAPEILRHEPVDARADQFSFCVAMYASLHGERPFEPVEGAGRIAETLGRRRARTGAVPRWLQRIITRGLAMDPRDRWPTMDALTAAIERGMSRRRRALVVIGSGTMAIAASVMMLMARATPAPRPPPADWSPVLIGRTEKGSPTDMVVSRDGSTVATISTTDAWIEPRAGAGTRHHLTLPFPDKVALCRLSHTGDQLLCSFHLGPGGFEIWAFDVATGHKERRVPPIAAPTLTPTASFDVGPDGTIVFDVADFDAVWQVNTAGVVRTVLTAEPGQMLIRPMWSPDGTRLAVRVQSPAGMRLDVVNTVTRTRAVASHHGCARYEWLTENSLVCQSRALRNPTIIKMSLPVNGGDATARVRYHGPEFQHVNGLTASSAGVLVSTSPNDQHLGILTLGVPGSLRRISSGGITDLPVAGWTSSGSLIFGASMQGQLRIMALRPDGRVETVRTDPVAELPLVVLGETIIFGRFPGGESTIPFFEVPLGRRYPDGELFRLTRPGGAVTSLGTTRGFVALACAGGRTTPCLLMERDDADVVAIDWDAETGARGRPRARWPMASYRYEALSPDGRTLVQVQRFALRGGELSLVDLESGHRRRIPFRGTGLDYPRWHPDGSLLAIGSSNGEPGIVRVRDAENIEMVAVIPTPDQPLTAAEEFEVAPDGKTVAILLTDLMTTHWWVPRSQY